MLSMYEQETTKFMGRFQCLLLLKNSRNSKLYRYQMQKKNSDVAARKKKIISCQCEFFFFLHSSDAHLREFSINGRTE